MGSGCVHAFLLARKNFRRAMYQITSKLLNINSGNLVLRYSSLPVCWHKIFCCHYNNIFANQKTS
jgi:hypothetical protein